MPDETGWLLEKNDKGANCFIGVIDGLLGWTTDPNKALRLSRRDDAEAIATICEDADRISEHLWPDMAAGASSAPATPHDAHDLQWWKREALALVTLLRAKCSDEEWAKLQKVSDSCAEASAPATAAPPQYGYFDCQKCGYCFQYPGWTSKIPGTCPNDGTQLVRRAEPSASAAPSPTTNLGTIYQPPIARKSVDGTANAMWSEDAPSTDKEPKIK